MTDPRLERAQVRGELLKRVLIVLTFLLVMVILSGMLYMIVLIRGTQTEGSPTQKRLLHISQRIDDCTSETGDCAARNAAKTGKAIQGIDENTQRAVVAALVCQERLHTTDKAVLAKCLREQLSQ